MTMCFIGRAVGVITFVSVFPNRVCVCADETDVVCVSAALVVTNKNLILLMKLSQSPGSNWIKVLTIVSCLLYGDLLR